MHRQVGDLAGDVPQRNIDGADRARVDVADGPPQVHPDCADIERVATHHQRLESLKDLTRKLIRASARRAEERVTNHTFVGLDGHDADIRMASPEGLAVGRSRYIPAMQDDRQVGDAHDGPGYAAVTGFGG